MLKKEKYRKSATEARRVLHLHSDSPPLERSDASFASTTPSAYVMKSTFNLAEVEVAHSTFWERWEFPF